MMVFIAPALVLGATGPLDYCIIRSPIQAGTMACPVGTCPYSNPRCGPCCLVSILSGITNWIFIGLIVLATIFIIIGGVLFIISGGDQAKTATARNYIIFAIVGIIIGLLAKAIPSIVIFFLQ